MQRTRTAQRTRAAAIALAPLLSAAALLAPAAPAAAQVQRGGVTPQPLCGNIPGGDFADGLAGWSVDLCEGGFGEWQTSTDVTVQDLTSIGCDEDVACLFVSTDTAWTCDKPSGSASQAQASIARTAKVRARYLRFKVFGSFEFFQFDEADVKYDAVVVVTDEEGNQVKCDILTADFQGDFGCPNGVQALGAIPVEKICCDLLGTGIEIGDVVTIEVIWSATVVACNDCDAGTFFGSFCVDEFQFCNGCPTPVPQLPLTPVTTITTASSQMATDEAAISGAPFDAGLGAAERLSRAAAFLGLDLAREPDGYGPRIRREAPAGAPATGAGE